jgi:hypothetical protein
MTTERFLTAADAAAYLGFSKGTLSHWRIASLNALVWALTASAICRIAWISAMLTASGFVTAVMISSGKAILHAGGGLGFAVGRRGRFRTAVKTSHVTRDRRARGRVRLDPYCTRLRRTIFPVA